MCDEEKPPIREIIQEHITGWEGCATRLLLLWMVSHSSHVCYEVHQLMGWADRIARLVVMDDGLLLSSVVRDTGAK